MQHANSMYTNLNVLGNVLVNKICLNNKNLIVVSYPNRKSYRTNIASLK